MAKFKGELADGCHGTASLGLYIPVQESCRD
jgi:hypothetical protein